MLFSLKIVAVVVDSNMLVGQTAMEFHQFSYDFALYFFCWQDAAARSLFSTKVDASKRGDGFNMGDRDSILDTVEAGPILVHVALAEGRQFPYEAIMRSVFKHLMDSATSEYLFTIEFFKVLSHVFNMGIPPLYCLLGWDASLTRLGLVRIAAFHDPSPRLHLLFRYRSHSWLLFELDPRRGRLKTRLTRFSRGRFLCASRTSRATSPTVAIASGFFS